MPSIQGLNTPTRTFSHPTMISSASPQDFSQLQLQSMLHKGNTVRKITEMKNIMQNEGWRSVASRPGEYQILLKSSSTPEFVSFFKLFIVL